MTARRAPLVAAVSLAVAVGVIVATPILLDVPNALSLPAAVIVAIGCAGAILGGRAGEVVALVVSVTGLIASALWLWLAGDGFGKGQPWLDDLVEAAILAVAFLVSVVALLVARRRPAA